jgi:hypothetical protein
MVVDPGLGAGLIGGGAAIVVAAVPFFVAWGRLHAEMETVKVRVAELEHDLKDELGLLREVQKDVSYIRGVLDGEARAAREAMRAEA